MVESDVNPNLFTEVLFAPPALLMMANSRAGMVLNSIPAETANGLAHVRLKKFWSWWALGVLKFPDSVKDSS